MTERVPTDALLRKLSEVFRRVAYGGHDRENAAELFELTKSREYPELLNELSEAFGMMMVEQPDATLDALTDFLGKKA